MAHRISDDLRRKTMAVIKRGTRFDHDLLSPLNFTPKLTLRCHRDAFDIYIEKVLLPELEPDTVVILDNLATHKSDKAAEILKTKHCWFLFLPPYSPDLNPIEMAFSKRKAHLRRIGARTFDQLLEAIGEICDLFTPDECWNFFKAAGYTS